MAGFKAYVMVDDFDVTDVFDKSYKNNSKLKKAMKAAAEKAIDSSPKLTTTPPKPENKLPQFYLTGTLSKLTLEEGKKNSVLKGKVEMVLGTYPDKSLFGFPTGSAPLDVFNMKKIDNDVEELAVAIVKDTVEKKVVAAIVAKLP